MPPTVNKRKISSELGQRGEQVAEKYLQSQGYKTRDKNWVCRVGELDLVCEKDGIIVFVEVKTRQSSAYAREYLFSTVTPKKQEKLKLLVEVYFAVHWQQLKKRQHRIDWVGLILSNDFG